MLYLYVNVRYHKQLQRIAPEVLTGFNTELADAVKRNGGHLHQASGSWFCIFSESSIGYLFASSRVLGTIRELFGRSRDRIREYLVAVDLAPDDCSMDLLQQEVHCFESMLIPDEALLLSSRAARLLASYIHVIPHPDSGWLQYTGGKLAAWDASTAAAEAPVQSSATVLYPDNDSHPWKLLRNWLSFTGYTSIPATEDDDFTLEYTASRPAVGQHEAWRFCSTHPHWRLRGMQAFYSTVLAQADRIFEEPLQIAADAQRFSALKDALQSLVPGLSFVRCDPPRFQPLDLKNIPEDLQDLAYLTWLASDLLFLDEMPGFFDFLGRKPDFLHALGIWLHTYGLLAVPDDLRTFNRSAMLRLETQLAERSNPLKRTVAGFLWSLYQKGSLGPCFELFELFSSLGFDCPDGFLLACVYRESDPASSLALHTTDFHTHSVYESARLLESAREKYESGFFSESAQGVKRVLHAFQQEGCQSGEYRALELLAMLTLAQNSDGDALTYLEYALDTARSLKDQEAQLATRMEMVTVSFVQGNLYAALCGLETVLSLCTRLYAKDREVFARFLEGRIKLELGDYRAAEASFFAAADLAMSNGIDSAIPLCRVWQARSCVYQGRYSDGEPVLHEHAEQIPDAWLFILESAILSGKAGGAIPALPVIASRLQAVPRENFSALSWQSGFAALEDRCYGTAPDRRFSLRMLQAFSAYRDWTDGTEQSHTLIIGQLESLARSAMNAHDPWAAVYYFFCYDVSRALNSGGADTITWLSRSFKYLQKRAQAISSNAVREQYMQKNLWNARLYRAARENMLI